MLGNVTFASNSALLGVLCLALREELEGVLLQRRGDWIEFWIRLVNFDRKLGVRGRTVSWFGDGDRKRECDPTFLAGVRSDLIEVVEQLDLSDECDIAEVGRSSGGARGDDIAVW